MQVILLPERWKVRLDVTDRRLEAADGVPETLVDYLSRTDLDF